MENKEHFEKIAKNLVDFSNCKVLLSSSYPTVVAAILDSAGFKGSIIASASALQNAIRGMITREYGEAMSPDHIKNIKIFGRSLVIRFLMLFYFKDRQVLKKHLFVSTQSSLEISKAR